MSLFVHTFITFTWGIVCWLEAAINKSAAKHALFIIGAGLTTQTSFALTFELMRKGPKPWGKNPELSQERSA
jgi:bacteriorhodopsin